MPANDSYKEVLVAITVGVFIMTVVAALIVFMVLYYQKRKLRHSEQLDSLQKQFSEALFRSQLEIQEQVFTDISREIHDNVGQVLSLARIQMGIMTESGRLEPALLEDVKDNVGKAMADLRDIARSLNSERIRSLPIHESVAKEIDRINKTSAIFTVSVNGDPCAMDERKKLILFRIIQEGIQNCLKHANASAVFINFVYHDELTVSITDNGIGFDPSAIAADGLGLQNMRARAILAGGSLSIESKPGTGTVVKITMPYG